jgi:hypothetical protein
MGGFNTITGDECIMFADNVSFDGTTRGGKLTVDGELLIGSTVAPHIKHATLTAPASGVAITNGSGSITFSLTDDLLALEGLATTGIPSRTAANTWSTSSITQHAVLTGGASQGITNLGPLTNGQLVVGSTGAAPVATTITAGTNISVTNAAGSITIAQTSTGGGIFWETIGASGALVVGKGYMCNAGAALSFSLPATAAVGTEIALTLDGSTSWTITQAANQRIRFGNSETTLGAGGSLASTAQGDTVYLVCVTANLRWIVISSIGNITII